MSAHMTDSSLDPPTRAGRRTGWHNHAKPDSRMETPVAGVRNLTQVEAAERARLLDVTAYDITLDLTDSHAHVNALHMNQDGVIR